MNAVLLSDPRAGATVLLPRLPDRPRDDALDWPLRDDGPPRGRWLGPAVSVALLGVVAYQFRGLDWAGLRALVPSGALFWAAFLLYYFMSPATEWVMFRRLWRLPVGGFPVLVRKLVGNELLFGYFGEMYFYAWARRHARLRQSPFGAIKDVTILSAAVGNVATLAMVVVAAPLLAGLRHSPGTGTIVASALILLATTVAMFLFRTRLFTLPARDLWLIAGLHLLRVVATTALGAVMWHLLLPAVPLSWLLLLATLRLLLSRLPLVPNKDVAFAGLAALLVGADARLGAAMALMATLILAAHLTMAVLLGVQELAQRRAPR